MLPSLLVIFAVFLLTSITLYVLFKLDKLDWIILRALSKEANGDQAFGESARFKVLGGVNYEDEYSQNDSPGRINPDYDHEYNDFLPEEEDPEPSIYLSQLPDGHFANFPTVLTKSGLVEGLQQSLHCFLKRFFFKA